MDIKQFIKTNRIFLSALVLLLIIIIILWAVNRPGFTYKVDLADVPAMLSDSTNTVNPGMLVSLHKSADKNTVVIDLRNSDEYAKGHLENAINIPVRDLLNKRSVKLFKDMKESEAVAILYGENQLQVNGPWMLLRQLGFDHLKVLSGGYSDLKLLATDSALSVKGTCREPEAMLLDTSAFLPVTQEKAPVEAKKQEKKMVTPVRKEKSSGGGC